MQVNSAFNALAVKKAYSRVSLFKNGQTALPFQGRSAVHAKHVHILHLYAHDQADCLPSVRSLPGGQTLPRDGLLGCALPNLRILCLYLATAPFEGHLHRQHHSFGWPCTVPVNLRPNVLVIDNAFFSVGRRSLLAQPLFSIGVRPGDSIERLVVVISAGGDESYPIYPCELLGLFDKCTTDITYVMLTRGRGRQLFRHRGEAEDFLLRVADEVNRLNKNCRLSFVNAATEATEDMNGASDGVAEAGEYGRLPGESKQQHLERMFRSAVARRYRRLGLETQAVADRQDLIRFITMDEYLAEPGVEDVFDPDELEKLR